MHCGVTDLPSQLFPHRGRPLHCLKKIFNRYTIDINDKYCNICYTGSQQKNKIRRSAPPPQPSKCVLRGCSEDVFSLLRMSSKGLKTSLPIFPKKQEATFRPSELLLDTTKAQLLLPSEGTGQASMWVGSLKIQG